MSNVLRGLPGRLLILVAACATLAALAPAADAARVSRMGSSLDIREDPLGEQATTEVNDITVTFSPNDTGGTFTVTDNATPLTATLPCTPVSSKTVTCPAQGATEINVNVGDLPDFVSLASASLSNSAVTKSQILGGSGQDTLLGLVARTDEIRGQDGDDPNLDGGGGNDTVSGGAGEDTMYGGLANDTLIGGSGSDDFNGGAGVDTADYSKSEVETTNPGPVGVAIDNTGNSGVGCRGVTGTCEGDIVRPDVEDLNGTEAGDVLIGSDSANHLMGNGGNDTLDGRGGPDDLDGNDGNDTIRGGAGADDIDGGNGNGDTVTYDERDTENITVDLNTAGSTNGGASDDSGTRKDSITAVENATTGDGDDILVGSNDEDAGNRLDGQGGDDFFRGLDGPDLFIGGGGTDEVSYVDDADSPDNDAAGNVTVTIGTGTGDDGSSDDGPANQRDTVSGDIEDVTGGPDNDSLRGSSANNVLDGAGGGDLLVGLTGADTFIGGAGNDRVSYVDRTDGVEASLNGAEDDGNAADGPPNDRDQIGLDVENLIGGAGPDILRGNGNGNSLVGLAGDDFLVGGMGGDSLSGDGGEDTVDYSQDGRTVGVTVTIGTGASNDGTAGEGDDVQDTVENVIGTPFGDIVTGDGDPNKLFGLAGNDTLNGLGGDDFLDGGADLDQVNGGANNDVLHGGSAGTASDGADNIDGGTGTDTVTYATVIAPPELLAPHVSQERAATVTVTLDNVANDGAADENDNVNLVENITGGKGNDTLVGSTGDAGTFANVLDGREGNDTLRPGTETATPVADTLIGDLGTDLADYSDRQSVDNLTITLDGTANDGEAGENDDIRGDVEDVSTAGGADNVTGNPQTPNKISTGAGNDTIESRDSNADTVNCGADTDTVTADRRDTLTGCETENLPAQPQVSVSGAAVTEGTGAGTKNLVFTVSLDDTTAQQVTVNYATSNGSAVAPQDYSATSGTATIAAGQTSTTFTVPIVQDSLDEDTETFTVTLTSPANAEIAQGGGSATGTINDDDAPPTVSVGSTSATEGNSGNTILSAPVTLSAPSSKTVTVQYATSDGTATQPGDYAQTTGTVTIPAGQTTGSATVNVVGDTTDEADETFTVTLSQPTNATLGTASATQTITDDDDEPGLSIADANVIEGDAGTTNATFDVTLSAASAKTVTVDYTTNNGTATQPGDYTTTSGKLTFEPGQTTQSVSVPVKGDTEGEPNETFTVTLSNPSNATITDGTANGTITDDDNPMVSVGDTQVTEGDAGTTDATFTVTLSEASSREITVDFATASGSAVAPGDFAAQEGTLTFAAGETSKQVVVPVAGDKLVEGDETFTLELSAADGANIADGTGTGTIVDNDVAPSLSVDDVKVTEGNAGTVDATFTVKLSGESAEDVTVKYATEDGTAKAGEDYTATSGTLTIPAGQTSGQIKVPVTGDTAFENDETFKLTLSEPQKATIQENKGTATGTITADDSQAPPAVPTMSINDVRVAEGAAGTTPAVFNVSLTVPTTASVTVRYATSDGTAKAGEDYTAASGTLTFAPGERTKTVSVPVTGDKRDEQDENFGLTLSNVVNASLADKRTGIGTITDDEVTRVAPGITFQVSPSRDRSLPYRFRTTGKLTRPAGVRQADACAGKVSIRVKAGKKTISTRRVSVRRDCTFRSTVSFTIKSRVKPGRLKYEVRFLGNAVLLPKSAARKFVRAG